MTIATIKNIALATIEQVAQSDKMRRSQIIDMDIIANAGAILGGIIGAEQVQSGILTPSGLKGTGDQMSRILIGLADATAAVGTGHIKIAQGHITKGFRQR